MNLFQPLVIKGNLNDLKFSNKFRVLFFKYALTDIEENVRKALHDAEELIRLMEQINNQLVMIEYWRKNLMNLNFTSIEEVAATMGKLQTIVDQALRLGYKPGEDGHRPTPLHHFPVLSHP